MEQEVINKINELELLDRNLMSINELLIHDSNIKLLNDLLTNYYNKLTFV